MIKTKAELKVIHLGEWIEVSITGLTTCIQAKRKTDEKSIEVRQYSSYDSGRISSAGHDGCISLYLGMGVEAEVQLRDCFSFCTHKLYNENYTRWVFDGMTQRIVQEFKNKRTRTISHRANR